MTGKAYKARIAASKARIEEDCERIAAENPSLDAQQLRDLIRDERNIPITEEYAEDLVARFSSGVRPR